MIDQLTINGVGSYDEYDANVKERTIGAPKKKVIKETVPFSNETYDFSAINGEAYWEERSLEYILEMTASSPEELEEKKRELSAWLMNVAEAEIHDPFITDFHFYGTFESISYEDEVEKTTATVQFSAYPYMRSNSKRAYTAALTTGNEVGVTIYNNSSHRVSPTFISDVPFVIKSGDVSFSVPDGEITDSSFMLERGSNAVSVRSTSGSGTLRIEFYEEVF